MHPLPEIRIYILEFIRNYGDFARLVRLCRDVEWQNEVLMIWRKKALKWDISLEEEEFFSSNYNRDWKWLLRAKKIEFFRMDRECLGSGFKKFEIISFRFSFQPFSISTKYNARMEGFWCCMKDRAFFIGQLICQEIIIRGRFDQFSSQDEISMLTLSGQGMIKYSKGDMYKGTFEGCKHGYGMYYWVWSGITYEGYWKNGLPHGQGKIIMNNEEHWDQFEKGKSEKFGNFLNVETISVEYDGKIFEKECILIM